MFNYGVTAVLKLTHLKLNYVVVAAVVLKMFAGQRRGSTCMVVELVQF